MIERFRQNGMEPSRPTATVLLGAILSDTVILNSPTTTDRDRAVVEYLERVLASTPPSFGREMFEAGSDVADVSADEIVARDAKEYEIGERPDDLRSRRSRRRAGSCSTASTSCWRRCGGPRERAATCCTR